MVLKNLNENNFITKKQYNEFANSEIKLKKRKIEIVNEANSYTEEVRRSVKENFGFEKLYSQGLSIRTPLNINYQIQAIKSLRKGIEEYDRRHGWRGPITNKFRNNNWEQKIDKIKLDPTLNWKIAEIVSLSKNQIEFKLIQTKEKRNGILNFNKIKWSIPKKTYY